MAISSCFVEDTDHGPHIVKSSHSLVGEREKKICILYGKTNQMKERIQKSLPIWKEILNYLMFSWNALCATNISKKNFLAALKIICLKHMFI
jgi:hypothetical protein